MASKSTSAGRIYGPLLFAALTGIALLLLPMILGARLTVSPMVLFGMVALTTVCNHAIPAPKEAGEDALFSRTFFLRLGVSLGAAGLILVVYHAALAFG